MSSSPTTIPRSGIGFERGIVLGELLIVPLSNMLVYLRDGSSETLVRAATARQKKSARHAFQSVKKKKKETKEDLFIRVLREKIDKRDFLQEIKETLSLFICPSISLSLWVCVCASVRARARARARTCVCVCVCVCVV